MNKGANDPTKTSPDRSAQEHERRVAAALAEYIDLAARSEAANIDDFCRHYPGIESDLRAALDTLALFDSINADEEAPRGEQVPERLSGHRILNELGAGGMARVFLADDETLGRTVAIKLLKERFAGNEEIRKRFMQEARALARLSHPNVVHIYYLGPAAEPPHFVMEYVEGVTLTEAASALSLKQKVELMRKVAVAAHFLHQHQIVHRDLKPGNILVGADLEPKLLDFGLARQVEGLEKALTSHGEIMGTPQYFSPEQARGTTPLDARSDIFSLGTILYELLTGTLPFRANDLGEQVRSICDDEPVLPRRLNGNIPGELQNICMLALEKRPVDRYATAREMADDLERFLVDEPVLAAPSSYARRMAGKIEQHVRELEGWRQDHILSDYEFDSLKKGYDRLVEREDAWIMEVRRLSLPQVALYLGAWTLVVGAGLLFLFRYLNLTGTAAVLVVAGATVPTGYYGIRCWKAGRVRISVAYLLAFCLLVPIMLLVAMTEYNLCSWYSRGREDLEPFLQFGSFKGTTNAQMWWALFLSLPAYLGLRRFTRSSVFSLVISLDAALLYLVTLLRIGLLDWLRNDPGRMYLRLIPAALIFFIVAHVLERLRSPGDSRYFYPLAVLFTYVSLSGMAGFHKPYSQWLGRTAPWTRGQVEYLFIINAAIYFYLTIICDRFRTPQMRTVGKAFRFVIPGHMLFPLLLLGLEATRLWGQSPGSPALHREARIFEVLLPAIAGLFVFLSVPKQMKNYLGSGMFFMAIGIVRLQQNWLKDKVAWPIFLLVVGVLLMLLAARYAAVRATLRRLWRRARRSTRP
ncbi:MAG: serine/threonine protein kinase [Acidobacteriia bacterium]|nr:serine/threonine protein kinase [Terriglobia bacterium]